MHSPSGGVPKVSNRSADTNSSDPSRLYVPFQLFERALVTIQKLRDAGGLRLLVGPPTRRLQFELRDDQEAPALLERHGLSRAELRDVLFDLEDVLVAMASDVPPERFAAVRANPNRFTDQEVEEESVALEKFRLASEAFDASELQRRFWIKDTAKAQVPSRFGWEVGIKRGDDEGEAPGGGGAVLGRLRIATESPDSPIASSGGNDISFVVDNEDVAYIIDSLLRLQRAMEDAEGSKE
jgi:hypothetical protein